ncbi:MAG: DUF2000 family protein [Rhodopila sp.]
MFDTKIAIVVREDLAIWQKLNVTAFLTSGIIGANEGLLGERYQHIERADDEPVRDVEQDELEHRWSLHGTMFRRDGPSCSRCPRPNRQPSRRAPGS